MPPRRQAPAWRAGGGDGEGDRLSSEAYTGTPSAPPTAAAPSRRSASLTQVLRSEAEMEVQETGWGADSPPASHVLTAGAAGWAPGFPQG